MWYSKNVVSAFLIGYLFNLGITSCMDGFQSSGFFRGDLLMLNEDDVRQNYERKLIVVLGVLPAKRHCEFLRTAAQHFSTSIPAVLELISKYSYDVSGRRFAIRRKCRRKAGRQDSKGISPNTSIATNISTGRDFIVRQLVRLYNKLPLPFQCQILEEVGWKSVVNSKDRFRTKLNSWSSDRTSELSRIVQQTEEVLGHRHPLMRVGSQCARIVSGEDSFVATVKFSCVSTVTNSKAWLRLFRKQMARVYAKFASENGIPIPKDVFLFVGAKNFPYSAYHVEILNSTMRGSYREVMFHIHLVKANSKALPANFILSSLHRYSKAELEHLFQGSNISFTAITDKDRKRPSRRYNNMRKLFPAYLSKYFSMLNGHEKCFILSMLSSYTNNTLSRIIQFLNRKRFQVQISCFPKRNDVSAKSNRENIVLQPPMTMSPPTKSRFYTESTRPFRTVPRKFYKKVYTPKTIVTITPVEISMFVVLGAVLIVGTMFVSICITYIRRKRALKGSAERPPAEGTGYGIGETDSVDSAELDWIKRTRKIELDSEIFKQMRTIVVSAPLTQVEPCSKCYRVTKEAFRANAAPCNCNKMSERSGQYRGIRSTGCHSSTLDSSTDKEGTIRSSASSKGSASGVEPDECLSNGDQHLMPVYAADEQDPSTVSSSPHLSVYNMNGQFSLHGTPCMGQVDLSDPVDIHYPRHICLASQTGTSDANDKSEIGYGEAHNEHLTADCVPKDDLRERQPAAVDRSLYCTHPHILCEGGCNKNDYCTNYDESCTSNRQELLNERSCHRSQDVYRSCPATVTVRDPHEPIIRCFKDNYSSNCSLKHLPSKNGRVNRATMAEPYNSRVVRGARRARSYIYQEQSDTCLRTPGMHNDRSRHYPSGGNIICDGTSV